ncbi:type II secretion system minor pseudopilin GspK [Geobacter pickeringii]|uniref:General secretion pathway protein GspK n=1 Tax=Geobacter pickeringii TaxID=345632 RepID=A0A0B5BAZ1_9BACT|nr:type II secretion system minor pseudopilin GspK [Geobacter pickeringii]AJE02119.1 general secretion pathway protein GspK [Geobacter pickeringii]
MRRSRQSERGFALVLTLVVTALLVAVAAEFIHEVYVETSIHRNFLNLQQASLMAQSGVTGGVELIRNIRRAGDQAPLLQVMAKPLELEDEKGSISVTIEEEDGKLNLNSVTLPNGQPNDFFDQAEQRLLKILGLPAALHDTLADWVDEDDDPRPDGAESAYYQKLTSPYLAKNAPFATFGELTMVRGVTPAVRDALRPFATIYGTAGGSIDLNTAPPAVIRALDDDMTEGTVKNIVDHRRTTPFTTRGEVANLPGMETIAPRLGTKIDVKGYTYRFVSTATVGDAKRIVEAVYTFDGAPRYLYWREY